MTLLIPALNPTDQLTKLLDQLIPSWNGPIILVDDGSGPEAQPVFREATERGCELVTHSENRGKGRALKSAFAACLERHPEVVGAITADADGQHAVADILACADALRANPSALVMGCRDFGAAGVPARNMLGNRITSITMRLLCGVRVSDTQTGLRGIPSAFMAVLLNVDGERFEFETNMLLETKRSGVPILEVPIATIYIEQGRASNFHAVRDSVRIYLLLAKYVISSTSATLVDLALFTLLQPLVRMAGGGAATIAISTVLARMVSATFNFVVNRNVVFHSNGHVPADAARYLVLCVGVVVASATLVTTICQLTHLPSLPVKIVVDSLLFFVNYSIQRAWVFPG